MPRYFTRELVAKGAVPITALPPFFHLVTEQGSPHNAFTTTQYERFTLAQLKTGAWFLDCSESYVPPTEIDLALSVGTVPTVQDRIDIRDSGDDDDFASEPIRRAARGGKRRAAARHQRAPHNLPIDAGVPSSQTESALPLRRDSEDFGDLTQGSQHDAVVGVGSPTPAERLSRLARAREMKRPMLSNSSNDTSSTLPANVSTLPIFLEHGDMGEVLNLSDTNSRMEPQAVRIMQHIRKVNPYSHNFILFSMSLFNRGDFMTLIIVILYRPGWERS